MRTTAQHQVKLLLMVTYALKIVPWNEQLNKSNFEKLSYSGLQEQAGASRVHRQDNNIISLKSLY